MISPLLQKAFDTNPQAFESYKNFAPSYRREYLYWLHAAKREATQQKQIVEIIKLCNANKKQPEGSWLIWFVSLHKKHDFRLSSDINNKYNSYPAVVVN